MGRPPHEGHTGPSAAFVPASRPFRRPQKETAVAVGEETRGADTETLRERIASEPTALMWAILIVRGQNRKAVASHTRCRDRGSGRARVRRLNVRSGPSGGYGGRPQSAIQELLRPASAHRRKGEGKEQKRSGEQQAPGFRGNEGHTPPKEGGREGTKINGLWGTVCVDLQDGKKVNLDGLRRRLETLVCSDHRSLPRKPTNRQGGRENCAVRSVR